MQEAPTNLFVRTTIIKAIREAIYTNGHPRPKITHSWSRQMDITTSSEPFHRNETLKTNGSNRSASTNNTEVSVLLTSQVVLGDEHARCTRPKHQFFKSFCATHHSAEDLLNGVHVDAHLFELLGPFWTVYQVDLCSTAVVKGLTWFRDEDSVESKQRNGRPVRRVCSSQISGICDKITNISR